MLSFVVLVRLDINPSASVYMCVSFDPGRAVAIVAASTSAV